MIYMDKPNKKTGIIFLIFISILLSFFTPTAFAKPNGKSHSTEINISGSKGPLPLASIKQHQTHSHNKYRLLAQRSGEMLYYGYMKKVRDLIKRDFYKPVQDETLVKGAFLAMKKILPSMKEPPNFKWNSLQSYYLGYSQQNPQIAGKLAEAAIDGMVNALKDPYSVLLNPAKLAILEGGDGSGIGVEVGYKNGKVILIAPIVGGPADKAGLKSGDWIVAVNGKSVKNASLYQTSLLIKGRKGDRINITVIRNGKEMTFRPRFCSLNIKPIHYSLLSKNIGYIRIGVFNGKIYLEFYQALNRMKERKVRGLIIDVRNNPGGDFDESLKMAARLVPKGVLVWTQTKGGKPVPKESGSGSTFPAPVVILVNEGSASASEVFAAAVSENGKGVTMGRKTFGKGVVQTEYRLIGKTRLNLTTHQYLTPKKKNINGKGLKPMIPLKNATQSPNPTKDDFVLRAWKYLDGK